MKPVDIIMPSGEKLEGIDGISFQFFNSIFDGEVLRGSFTSAVTIKATAQNRYALGFSHLPESNEKPTRTIQGVKARIAGQYLDCSLKIVNCTESAYYGSLLLGWGTMVEQMDELLLSNTDFEPVQLVDSPVVDYTIASMNAGNYPNYLSYLEQVKERVIQINDGDYPVCFPLLFFESDPLVLRIKNDLVVDYLGNILIANRLFHPGVFMKYLLTEGLSKFGKVVSGAFLDDPDISRVVLFSDRDLYTRYIENSTRDWIRYPKEFNPAKCLPKISWLEFIKKVKNTFWLPMDVSYFRNTIVIRTWDEIFNGTKIVDWTDLVEGNDVVDLRLPEVPGIKTDYWQNIPDKFFDAVFQGFEDKVIRPTVATFADLPTSPLPEVNDIRFVTSLGFFFAANLSDDGGSVDPDNPWKPYAYAINEFQTGAGAESRMVLLPTLDDARPEDYPAFDSSKWGYVTRYFGFDSTGEVRPAPFFSNVYEKEGAKGEQVRISFWMGQCEIQEFVTDNSHTYSASSVGEVAPTHFFPQISELGNTQFTLWQTTNQGRPRTSKPGLYQKFGTRYWDFMTKTKKQRFKVRLSETDLIQVDNTLKYRIGNNLYFLDAIRGSFPVKASTEVEAWWIPPGF